jgi:enoyl-CoA hydratase/carnithine racemase
MSEPSVLIERRGPIAIVTLNEPQTRNALSERLIAELCAFIATANADETLSCLVLTGAGEGFCSGGNVREMYDRSQPMYRGAPYDMKEGYRKGIQQLPLLFDALDVPVVAAVNGHAIGAGCDLALMCDIRIGADNAKFAESFLRVGIVAGDGGAWLLPRVVGLPRALEMALTCRMLDADEAKEWGLVTHIAPRGELLAEAVAMAEKIAAFPPKSIRLNKRLIHRSQSRGLRECLELSAAYQAIIQNTADQREAVAAMIEKRAPHFQGK